MKCIFTVPPAAALLGVLTVASAANAPQMPTLQSMIPSFNFGPQEQCPTQPDAALAQLGDKAPSAAEIANMLTDVQKDYAAREGVAGMQALKQALAKLPDNPTVANAGAALYMGGNTVASVYTLASAAAKDANPLTLANLGAALNQAKDYMRAIEVLRFAATIKPQAPLILSNLGVSYVQVGDFKRGEAALKSSLQYNPKQVEANYALGKLYQCQHDNALALSAFRASEEANPTARAATAITALSGKPTPTLDQSEGADTDGGAMPQDNPNGSHANEEVDIPEPHIPNTPWDYLMGKGGIAITQASSAIAMRATALEHQAEAVGQNGVHNIPRGGSTGLQMSLRSLLTNKNGDVTYWYQADEAPRKAMLHLYDGWYHDAYGAASTEYSGDVRDIENILDSKSNQAEQTYNSCIAAARSEAAAKACLAALCRTMIPASEQAYDASKTAFYAYHARMARLIQQLYAKEAKYQDRMTDPDDFDAMELWRASIAMQSASEIYTPDLAGVAENVVWKSGCGPNGDGTAPDQPKPRDPNKGKAPPCNFGLDLDFIGVVSLKANCTKLSIQGGELVKGRLDFDVRTKVATAYIGLGGSLDANLSAGPLSYKAGSVGAEGGVFTSFDTGGNVLDVGAYGNVSGSIGPMNASGGVQIGIASGVNFT